MENIDLSTSAREAYRQLFFHGPTSDGDIVSKSGRQELIARGLAARLSGWSYLTEDGIRLGLHLGLDRDKEKWDRERRKRSAQTEATS